MEIHERSSGDVTILDLKDVSSWVTANSPFENWSTGLTGIAAKLLLNFARCRRSTAPASASRLEVCDDEEVGGTLKLMHLTRRSRELLQVTKLITVLETFDSEEEALKSFVEP